MNKIGKSELEIQNHQKKGKSLMFSYVKIKYFKNKI